MTKSEIGNPNEARPAPLRQARSAASATARQRGEMTKSEEPGLGDFSTFGFRISFVIRHSDFGFRQLDWPRADSKHSRTHFACSPRWSWIPSFAQEKCARRKHLQREIH